MRRFHYAWVVAAVAFLAIMLPAALRGVLSILVVPLEAEFGWSRGVVSAAAAVSMLLFGLLGPFAAALMQRLGVRRVMLGGLLLLAVGMGIAPFIATTWLFLLVWGVGVGVGAGVLGMVMGAAVINRWFLRARGMAMGVLGAGIATAQLVVLPPAAMVVRDHGWRTAVVGCAGFVLVVLLAVWLWMRDRPGDVGSLRYGEEPAAADPSAAAAATAPATAPASPAGAWTVLRDAAKVPAFWYLCLPFFVCGLSTAGLIAIHLVPASIEHGVPEVQSALLLSLIGVSDFVGTLGAGWLSDRYDNARLLFAYYTIRATALAFLPLALGLGASSLTAFAVVYGLGWVATVPPTNRLCANLFGPERGSVVFGWVFASHQMGAATAALGAGIAHDWTGSYTGTFLAVAVMTFAAGIMSLAIRPAMQRPVPAVAAGTA